MLSSSGRSGREAKATLAQLAERLTRNEKVDSSILSSGSSTSCPFNGRVCRTREWRNGSRAGFRFLCLRTCGFESHLAHRKHKQGLRSYPKFHGYERRPCLMPRNQYRLSCLFLRQATKPTRPSASIAIILSTESGHPPVRGREALEGRNSSACDTGADSFPPLKLPL